MQQSTTEPQPFVLGEKQEAFLRHIEANPLQLLAPEHIAISDAGFDAIVNMHFEQGMSNSEIAAAIRSSPQDYFIESI